MTGALQIIAIALTAVGVFLLGYAFGRIDRAVASLPEPEIHTVTTDAKEAKAEQESFPVARTDRRPTWRQRRKQLEAAARKERERIEAWRG